MTIGLVLKSQIVAGVPARWAKHYKDYRSWGYAEKATITERLSALPPGFTAEQVDEIIGNKSWTSNECTECGKDAPVLVRVGEEPAYEARWVELCPDCLNAAVAALSGDKQ